MKKIFAVVAVVMLLATASFAQISTAKAEANLKQSSTPQTVVGRHSQEEVQNFPHEVVRLVNKERKKAGLQPLRFADDLAASALVRAVELPAKFSHTRPNGLKCFTAMAQRGHVLGENLAGGQTTPKQVVQAWMDSKTHRDNILGKNYTEIGVVYYYQSKSKYKHYWVQHFRG